VEAYRYSLRKPGHPRPRLLICYNTDTRPPTPHNLHKTLTLRSSESSTFDAWRVGGCLAAFLLCCATYALVFAAEDESKLRRCITAGATAEQCLLTVYGR